MVRADTRSSTRRAVASKNLRPTLALPTHETRRDPKLTLQKTIEARDEAPEVNSDSIAQPTHELPKIQDDEKTLVVAKSTQRLTIADSATEAPNMYTWKENDVPLATKQAVLSAIRTSESNTISSSLKARGTESIESGLDSSTVGSSATLAVKKQRPSIATKTKGTLAWLKKTWKTKDTAKPAIPSAAASQLSDTIHSVQSVLSATELQPTVDTVVEPKKLEKFTTPLQQLLWLSTVMRAIAEAKAPLVIPRCLSPRSLTSLSPKSLSRVVSESKKEGAADYYNNTRDTGVYVDYSTFDDENSESSLELLFKWLSCRDLNETKKPAANPPGTVFATETSVSDDLSMDLEAKPRRRTIFTR